VLDYVVKNLIDRGESSTLRVAEDLSYDDETSRISGKDLGREVDQLQGAFSALEDTYRDSQHASSSSPAAQAYSSFFVNRLGRFLEMSRDTMTDVSKQRDLMDKKIQVVVEYFGEDQRTCETTKVFSVLKEFKSAFEASRNSLLGRMERARSRQERSVS
jgi:hypothetical protein